ncbi:hypothetical protein C2G38_2142399 [Gigaspora rosea]|uniref:Uncharacterized protein n=1 Tax=Gigaspora rosea TaxID=44941 RepID=A0A397V7H7_9GLOM|nr:hypothetical protein C2G38_2142399 [Gigaspora rosea]
MKLKSLINVKEELMMLSLTIIFLLQKTTLIFGVFTLQLLNSCYIIVLLHVKILKYLI